MTATASDATVFTDCRLIDGLGGEVIEHGELEIRDGIISYCGASRSDASRLGNAHVIDVAGRSVLPGLIDCHIHMAMIGDASCSYVEGTETYAVLRAAAEMRSTLEAGITTVRDVGGRHYMEMDLRRAIGEGHALGPRLVLAGKIVCVSSTSNEVFPGCMREADNIPAIRAAVREQLKAGADMIKVLATGFQPGEDPDLPQFTTEELSNIVEIAHMAGRKVAAHSNGVEGIRRSVDAGVDTVEHGCALVDGEDVANKMGNGDTFLVPTFSLYKPVMEDVGHVEAAEYLVDSIQRFFAKKDDSLRCAISHGVPIAMGTDAGAPGTPHGTNAEELTFMVNAGMTPMDAIVASTSNAARAIGLDHRIGSLEVGKEADIIVVDGDPVNDVGVLARKESFFLVAKQGRPVAGTALERPRIMSDLDEQAAAWPGAPPDADPPAPCCDHPVT